MPARRALLLRLPLEDGQRLEIVATRRRLSPEELVEQIVLDWLDGPGRGELVDVLLRPRRTPSTRRPARAPGEGQLQLVSGDGTAK